MFSRIVSKNEGTNNVIDMVQAAKRLRLCSTSPSQSVTSRSFEPIQAAAILDRAVTYVERVVSARFPDLVGAMREKMVSVLSEKVVEDPHARKLLSA